MRTSTDTGFKNGASQDNLKKKKVGCRNKVVLVFHKIMNKELSGRYQDIGWT